MRSAGVRRAGVLALGAVIGAVGFASAASAHVTVSPTSAPQGGYTVITFRVPTESDTLSTTKLQVFLPTDQPLASVLVMPVPGWTAKVATTKLATPIKTDDGSVTQAVSKIVWSGGKIDPGQFQEFDVSLGPLPKDTDTIVFKALQTYSDGTVVRWIDLRQPGQPEPDHPAPVLHLTPPATGAGTSSTGSSGSSTTSTTGTTPTTAAPTTAPSVSLAADGSVKSSTSTSDTGARTLGIAGLIVGALGFGTAIVALRRKNV